MSNMPEVITKVATLEEKVQTILDNQGKQDLKLDRLGLTMEGLSTRINIISEDTMKNKWDIERLYEKDGIVEQTKLNSDFREKTITSVNLIKWLAVFVGAGTVFNVVVIASRLLETLVH